MRFFGKGRQRNIDEKKRGKGGGEDDTTSRTSISSSLFSSSKTEERDDDDDNKAITKLMCIMGERDIKGERGNSGFEDDDVSLSPSLFSAETVHDDDILFMQQQQKLIRGRRNNNNINEYQQHSSSVKPPLIRKGVVTSRGSQSNSILPRRNGSINIATRQQRRRRHTSSSNSSINENWNSRTSEDIIENADGSRDLCPPKEQGPQTPVQIQHDGVKYKVMIDCDNGQGDIRTENERKQKASSLITTKKQTYEQDAEGRRGAEEAAAIKKKGEERNATAEQEIESAYEVQQQQQQQEERITVPTADKSTDIITERLPLHYLECKSLVKRFFQDPYYPNVMTASSLDQHGMIPPQLENLFRVDGDNNNNNNNNDAFGYNTFRFMNEVSELLLGTTISGSTDDQRSMMLSISSHANALLDKSYTILSECANALKCCSSVVLDNESTDDDNGQQQQQHDMMTKKTPLSRTPQDEIIKMKQEMTRLKEENEVLKAEISKTNNIYNNNAEEDQIVSLQTTTTKFERSSGSLLVEI